MVARTASTIYIESRGGGLSSYLDLMDHYHTLIPSVDSLDFWNLCEVWSVIDVRVPTWFCPA